MSNPVEKLFSCISNGDAAAALEFVDEHSISKRKVQAPFQFMESLRVVTAQHVFWLLCRSYSIQKRLSSRNGRKWTIMFLHTATCNIRPRKLAEHSNANGRLYVK